MKKEGYVICQPLNTWGDETKPKVWANTHTFGKTPLESWILFLGIDYQHPRWYEIQQKYINRGACPKKATLEIEV